MANVWEFISRRWFLLALVIGVGYCLWQPESMSWTNVIHTSWAIVPSLFLMSLSLPTKQIQKTLSKPYASLLAAVLSFSLMPLLALLFGQLTTNADIRVGLLIMAAAPCTLASVVIWTRMAGGNEATALLVIVITTSSSWFFSTLWLTTTITTGQATEIDPFKMMIGLLANMVLPMALGQIVSRFPKVGVNADQHKKLLGSIAQLFILLIIYRAAENIGQEIQNNDSLSASPFLLVEAVLLPVSTHFVGLLISLSCSVLLGFPLDEQHAIAFASSQKTLPVALLLFTSYYLTEFPLAIIPIAAYHFGQLIVDTFIAERLHKRLRLPPETKDSLVKG